jgi:tRNA(Ile)-lysidine synthase
MDHRLFFESAAASGMGTWPEGTVFLAAVSGGADSTAMLSALAPVRREKGWRLYAVHVDHGIRSPEESLGDAEAVKKLCGTLGVSCRVVSAARGRVAEAAKAGGIGIEAAARKFRHAAWNREAFRIGAAGVLVAHTRDDLIETLLMRFLRGAGPGGLAAMPRSRGRVLRPLLDLGRADVLRYLAEGNIPFRTDATNADPVFLRNRIRNKLIPFLDEWFPHWKNAAVKTAETQRLAADFIAGEARRRLPWSADGGSLRISAEDFFSQPEIIREEALFRALDRLKERASRTLPPGSREPGPDPQGSGPDRRSGKDPAPPRRTAVALFARGGIPALDLGEGRIERRGSGLVLVPREAFFEAGFSLLIKEPGLYKLKGLTVGCVSPHETRGRDGFFAELPLVLRRNYGDDYILRAGLKRYWPKMGRLFRSRFTDVITAADAGGAAAFIGAGREGFAILLCREERVPYTGKGFFFFIVSGGIDVQRSE